MFCSKLWKLLPRTFLQWKLRSRPKFFFTHSKVWYSKNFPIFRHDTRFFEFCEEAPFHHNNKFHICLATPARGSFSVDWCRMQKRNKIFRSFSYFYAFFSSFLLSFTNSMFCLRWLPRSTKQSSLIASKLSHKHHATCSPKTTGNRVIISFWK